MADHPQSLCLQGTCRLTRPPIPSAARMDFIFPLILATGLLISPVPVWALLFYLTIPAFTLYRLSTGWRLPWSDPSIVIGLALILWSIATLAWGHDPSGVNASKLLWLGNGLSTLAFFLAWLMASDSPEARAWLEPALLIGGAGNAIFAIAWHFLFDSATPRMRGWGVSGQPVIGGVIMAIFFVLALDHLLRTRKALILHIAALALFAAFMLLSGSRTPILATAVATIYLLRRENWRIWFGFAAAGLGAAVLVFLLVPGWIKNTVADAASRGSDFHTVIWRAAINAIAQHPILGYGPTARLPLILPDLPYPFPHNFYLSLLFYSGAVGLVLFLGLIVSLVLRASWDHSGRVALCLIPLIAGLSDLSQIIKGPSSIWYIVWVPVLLLVTDLRHRPATTAASSQVVLENRAASIST